MIYIVSDIENMSNKSLIPLQTFKSCLVCLQPNNPLANISVDELKMLEHIVDAKFTDQRLPNKACEGCLKELEFCSKFIEKCKYSYSTLLAALEEENGEINYSSDISDHKEFELDYEERNGNIKADRTEAAVYIKKELDNEDTNLACAHCKEIFLSKDGWMEHLKTHSFPRYECTICGINFKYAEALTKHLGTLSHKRSNKAEVGTAHMRKELDKEDPNLECAHCKEIFLSKNEWMEHLKTHSFPRYECTICGKNFKNADALTKHEGTVGHKNRKEQTETSSKNRKTFKDLFTQAKDSGKLKLTCTLCARVLTTYSAASYHWFSHTGEKPFSCEHCGKKFLSKSTLIIHIRQHTGETPYKCKVCNKGFKSSTSCKKHENVHHFIVNDEESETDTQNKIAKNGIDDDVDPNADKVECEICKRKIHKLRYGVHRKSHLTEKKQYICTYCNKEFQKNSRLQQHLRIHTGDRPYVCEICSKSHIQAGNLKRHIMTHHHLGTKQFQCQHCGKFYSTKAGLESHVRTHSKTEKTEHTDPTKRRPIVSNTSKRLSNASNKEKKFLCMICGKTYTAKGTLKQHILHHTGETPHKCIICYKGFYNKTVLKYHMMKVHTDDKPYGCLICHKHFYDTRNLKRHMDRVHSSVDTVNNEDEEVTVEEQVVSHLTTSLD